LKNISKTVRITKKTLQKLQNASQAVESLPKLSRSFQKLLERFKGSLKASV